MKSEGRVLSNVRFSRGTIPVPVGWYVADSAPSPLFHGQRRDLLARQVDVARRHQTRAKDGFGKLSLSVIRYPRDRQDFPGVNIEFLKQVRDNEVAYYSPDEDNPQRKAWFNLLDILNRTDEAVLRKASTGKATFAQLYKQPNTYRGKLVTVEGYVKWAVPHAATKNDKGIEDIYELWVSVDREATVVQCLQLPKGFPIGNDVLAKVEITGFFYKKYAYRPHHAGEEARPDLKVAPVLLAKTVKWISMESAAEANGPSTEAIWAAVAGALAIALVFTWWIFSRRRRWGAVQLDRKGAAALDHLENVEMTGDVVVSIEAAMQQQDETPR